MREDIKQEWIEALESGNYPQGKQWLQKDGAFCCWGVLCEIAVRHGVMEHRRSIHDNLNGDAYRWLDAGNASVFCASYPPDELIEWAEIDREAVPKQDVVYYLGNVNDNGSNFNYIANEIREYL